MKLVRALLATVAALGAAAALQVVSTPAASALQDSTDCVACWNSTGP